MSIEQPRPRIIAFDGLHRTGKGTQCDMLQRFIADNGGSSLVVRGDGTREGLGVTPGDPYSLEWQSRNSQIKSPTGGTIEAWNASAILLSKELVETVKKNEAGHDVIIVDRSLVSRSAFLLHRGVGMKGVRFALDDMYPVNDASGGQRVDYGYMVPDVLFDLQVDSPAKLLARLDPNDPKFNFRSRNIKGGFDPAMIASAHLPESEEANVVLVDAEKTPEEIHKEVLTRMGYLSISQRLF